MATAIANKPPSPATAGLAVLRRGKKLAEQYQQIEADEAFLKERKEVVAAELIEMVTQHGVALAEKSVELDVKGYIVSVTSGHSTEINEPNRLLFAQELERFDGPYGKNLSLGCFFNPAITWRVAKNAHRDIKLFPERLQKAFHAVIVSKPKKPSLKVVKS